MRLRVYIETTLPSFYHEVGSEPEMIARRNWTRTWWDTRRHAYLLVTSEAVIDELQAGTFPNQDQALALLANIPLVPVEPAIIEIVETYIQRLIMPRDPTGDALHLALASYHNRRACVPCMRSCLGVKVPCPGVRGAEGQGKRKGGTVRSLPIPIRPQKPSEMRRENEFCQQ